MYGPDENNYTCSQCNTDYYNLEMNNVQFCKSCDKPEINDMIKCEEEIITIEYNHWMGFDGDLIISSICPSNQCCMDRNGCDYIYDKSSLCAWTEYNQHYVQNVMINIQNLSIQQNA